MSGSMVDIQSLTAENRRGKKEERKKERRRNHMNDENIHMVCPITYGGHKIAISTYTPEGKKINHFWSLLMPVDQCADTVV